MWLLLIGLGAGFLSTLAGLGGGLFLTVVLAGWWGPSAALAVAAPALLFGNLHRAWLFRASIDRRTTVVFSTSALAGGLFGGGLAASLPEEFLRWLLLFAVIFALSRQIGWLQFNPRSWLMAPGAFGASVLTATSGAGGPLLTSLLLAAGLRGSTFVATTAVTATAMHVGRIITYGAVGWLNRDRLLSALMLGVAILAGNVLGRRLRPQIGEDGLMWMTYAIVVAALIVTVTGL